jgi:hypothetical protein
MLICRESLHNIVRHAAADRVDISLQVVAGETALVIADNGRGFDPAASRPGRLGLQSMRERAAEVGGMLELLSVEGAGTQVRVRVSRRGEQMDELEPLIDAYRLRASASVASKLDVLIDIDRIRDARVVPFLLTVLGDCLEAEEVRVYVLKQLRDGGRYRAADRPRVAKAIGELVAEESPPELRLQATLALGEFVEIDGVLSLLNDVCLAKHESIDLRYAAFTSLERAGPMPKSIALLRVMSNDETLGGSARGLLSAWHVE